MDSKVMILEEQNEELRERVVKLEKMIHDAIPFVGYESDPEELKRRMEAAVDYPFRFDD